MLNFESNPKPRDRFSTTADFWKQFAEMCCYKYWQKLRTKKMRRLKQNSKEKAGERAIVP